MQTREFCHMLVFTIGVQKIAEKKKVYDIEVKNKNSRHLKFFEIINNNCVLSIRGEFAFILELGGASCLILHIQQ